jgi:hypothetical protein
LETLPELVLQHGKLPGELVERMKKAAADLLTAAERIRPS